MLLINCYSCGKQCAVPAGGLGLCNDCNGVNEAKRKEKERWNNLTDSQKIEELLIRVQALENHECNPMFG